MGELEVKFSRKRLFGKDLLQPECNRARDLLKFMGRKNEVAIYLPMDRLEEVENLGFKVIIEGL